MAKNLVDQVAKLEGQAEKLTQSAHQEAKDLAQQAEQQIEALRQKMRDELQKITKNLEDENKNKVASAIESEKQDFEAKKRALDEKAQSLVAKLAEKLVNQFFQVNDGG